MPKVMLIGMNNPLSMDPRHALYPHPPGCAGWNLHRKMDQAMEPEGGFPRHEYVDIFDRVNLVRGDWNDGKAVSKAAQLIKDAMKEDGIGRRNVVLLGSKVLRSFRVAGVDLEDKPQFVWTDPKIPKARNLWAHIPHPSGRSRAWNDPAVRDSAMSFFKHLVTLARQSAQGE